MWTFRARAILLLSVANIAIREPNLPGLTMENSHDRHHTSAGAGKCALHGRVSGAAGHIQSSRYGFRTEESEYPNSFEDRFGSGISAGGATQPALAARASTPLGLFTGEPMPNR